MMARIDPDEADHNGCEDDTPDADPADLEPGGSQSLDNLGNFA